MKYCSICWRFLFPFTDNQIQEEETVLDFSSGSAQEVENTATEVKQTTTIETTNGFEILTKGYEKLGLDQELAGIGNITIFAPRDDDFKKAGIDIDNIGRPMVNLLSFWQKILKKSWNFSFCRNFLNRFQNSNFVISAFCLHFNIDYQLFVYISILIISYMFTFQTRISAICLHL